MKTMLPLLVALALGACEKKIKAEPEAPRQMESVPISNNPAHGAAMMQAADRAADKADAANADRAAEPPAD